jgi:hypothetical protein
MPGSTLTNGRDPRYSNAQLNSFGSIYANKFGKSTTSVIRDVARDLIYDASDERFYDLSILSMKSPIPKPSDEFFYDEKVYGRAAISATSTYALVTYPNTQTFTVANPDAVNVDMILGYPDNSKGVIISKNTTTNEIVVRPATGSSLPAVSVNDRFFNATTIEADDATKINQYFRMTTVRRVNYIELFVSGLRYGRVELIKLNAAGTNSNRQAMEAKEWRDQFRIGMSNQYWNGEQAEYILEDGTPAKSMGGIIPTMNAAGVPRISTTSSSAGLALEQLSLRTRFKQEGTRFLYTTSDNWLTFSKYYKDEKTRYNPPDSKANLDLSYVVVAGEKIVFVPMDRWQIQSNSFPESFSKLAVLLDQESINPVMLQSYPEALIQIGGRKQGVNFNNQGSSSVLEASFSCEFNNPLGGGFIEFTD